MYSFYKSKRHQVESFSDDVAVDQHKDVNVKTLMERMANGYPLDVQDNGLTYESDLIASLSVDEGVLQMSDLTDIDNLKKTLDLGMAHYRREAARLKQIKARQAREAEEAKKAMPKSAE